MAIPKVKFIDCFVKWEQRWYKYIRLQGDYSEENLKAIALGRIFFANIKWIYTF